MPNFDSLNNLIDFDYSQMRALKYDNRSMATNDVIFNFVKNLNDFFDQFNNQQPDKETLNQFEKIINQVISKASNTEYLYYKDKYSKEYGSEYGVEMAESAKINDISALRSRMQYWAASETWGDAIRNPEMHIKATDSLNIWDKYLKNQNNLNYTPPVLFNKKLDFNSYLKELNK